MKYIKYALIGLGALALIALVVAAVYAVSYFRAQNAAITFQNDAAAKQAAVTAPSISLAGISCDIARDAKTQYYSLVIRTTNANVGAKQKQVIDRIQALGGTISANNQTKITDREAGYSLSANLNAALPLAQANAFISQIKSDVVPPDYTEDENNYVQDAAAARQTCQTSLDQLKNLASTEALYLNQITSDQAAPSTLTPISDKSNLITQKLMDVRQNASNYRNNIDSVLNQLNKTLLTITIKEIPG